MLGLYFTDKVPFKDVYLHGLILDERGQKMSKSKGNVINPMDTVTSYGSDALRIGTISNRSAGQNQAFSISNVVAGRNFANKLWNIARFIEGKIKSRYKSISPQPQTLADHWVIGELLNAKDKIERQLESYRFAEAAETVYHVIWDNVADWYIEASKLQENPAMLAWVLDTSLKLAHPFAPFVTETIWQTLSWHSDLLISTKWPETVKYDQDKRAQFNWLQKLISEVRYVITELPSDKKYALLHQDNTLITKNADLVKKLAKLEAIEKINQPHGLRLAVEHFAVWLDVDEKILAKYHANLEARLDKTHQLVIKLEARLNSESYIKKAPANLIEESRQQLESHKALSMRLQAELKIIK